MVTSSRPTGGRVFLLGWFQYWLLPKGVFLFETVVQDLTNVCFTDFGIGGLVGRSRFSRNHGSQQTFDWAGPSSPVCGFSRQRGYIEVDVQF